MCIFKMLGKFIYLRSTVPFQGVRTKLAIVKLVTRMSRTLVYMYVAKITIEL